MTVITGAGRMPPSLELRKERIKNPTSYMLTLLHNSKEQMNLDITDQVSHDMVYWNSEE